MVFTDYEFKHIKPKLKNVLGVWFGDKQLIYAKKENVLVYTSDPFNATFPDDVVYEE